MHGAFVRSPDADFPSVSGSDELRVAAGKVPTDVRVGNEGNTLIRKVPVSPVGIMHGFTTNPEASISVQIGSASMATVVKVAEADLSGANEKDAVMVNWFVLRPESAQICVMPAISLSPTDSGSSEAWSQTPSGRSGETVHTMSFESPPWTVAMKRLMFVSPNSA